MARDRISLDVDYLVKEYVNGASTNRLAKEFRVSRSVVDRRLVNAGVTLRTQSQAEAVKWSRMNTTQRERQVAAAPQASRGRKVPLNVKISSAKAKFANGSQSTSPLELRVKVALKRRGITTEKQTPIGPYNCDLTIPPVAVEIYGGKWHWHGHHLARVEDRFRYIMNAGWNIVVIAITDSFPLNRRVADYLATEINRLRSDPPKICQYRVIWGAGEFTTGGSLDDDKISIEPPFTSRRNPRTGRYETIPR